MGSVYVTRLLFRLLGRLFSPQVFLSFARIGPGLTFSILVMYTSFFLPLVVYTLFVYLSRSFPSVE